MKSIYERYELCIYDELRILFSCDLVISTLMNTLLV